MVEIAVAFIMIIAMSLAINRMISRDWNKTFDIVIVILCIIALIKI